MLATAFTRPARRVSAPTSIWFRELSIPLRRNCNSVKTEDAVPPEPETTEVNGLSEPVIP